MEKIKKVKKPVTGEKRSTVRMQPELYNKVLAEAQATLSPVNEVIKRRLMIAYGLMPDPRGNK